MYKHIIHSRYRDLLLPVADASLRFIGRLKARRYDIENTRIVAASTRGGSTWLAEILLESPGYTMLWEPFHPGFNPDIWKYEGFGWQNYPPGGTLTDAQVAYIRRLLTGRECSTQTMTTIDFSLSDFLSLRGGYLAKLVNAHLILYEIATCFNVKTVLMLRHPCAVVSSKIRHGGWGHVTKENVTLRDALFEDYPHLGPIFDSVDGPEEIQAFIWGVQTYVPLSNPAPHPWHLTTYESLVTSGPEVIEDIFDYFGEPVPESARNRLDIPSATASGTFQHNKKQGPLRRWKKHLSDDQIDRILEIVHRIGVPFYDRSLMPSDDLTVSHPV